MNANSNKQDQQRYLLVLLPVVLFFLCLILYLPGLNSLFLFDDQVNLRALEVIQGLGPSDEGFWEFVHAGEAGPLGRPLSLITFALQAEHWPDNPAAFKWINLLLHLGNGILVYFLLRSLAFAVGLKGHALFYIPLITSALWLLHPAHTATVLYAVQRMTLLSHTFMLASLLCYLKIRLHYSSDWKHAGFLVGLGLAVILAVSGLFAKENAVTLLFYVLALEFTVLSEKPCNSLIRAGRLVLWVPVIILAFLLLINLPEFNAGYESRYEYGMVQRLLTESRILWFYLWHTLVPVQGSTGLFISFDVSTGLFNPLTTLLSVSWWLVLTVAAVKYRKLLPVVALALFWFFAGHMLESTVLPLELFFNHRNYLAMLGPLFLLVWAAYKMVRLSRNDNYLLLINGLFLGLILFFSVQLFITARLWSQPVELARVWYENNPDELRNEQLLANQLAQQGGPGLQQAMDIYAGIMTRQKDELWPLLNWLILSCYSNPPVTVDQAAILEQLNRERKQQNDLLTPLRQLNNQILSGQCTTADQIPVTDMLVLLENGQGEKEQGFIRYELAQHSLRAGDIEQAMGLMNEAFELTRDPGILFNQADLLIGQQQYQQALVLVDQGLAVLQEENNIETGTRAMKTELLLSMREYLVDVMAAGE